MSFCFRRFKCHNPLQVIVPLKISILAAVLVVCSTAWSQKPSPTVEGSFIVSAGPGYFRGKWSASFSERTPNTAAGSWILLNERNDIVLQGTWSARKNGAAWRGTWRARVLRGRAYSGIWTATEPGPDSKTFSEMLAGVAKNRPSGTWSSAGYGGNWRLGPTP